MKTLLITSLSTVLLALLCISSANACSDQYGGKAYYKGEYGKCMGKVKAYPPVALCQTSSGSLGGTRITYPAYVCCELLDKKSHHVWRDTWVSGACTNANPYARSDMGCGVDSPVYGTNAPILGSCQFSYSTGMYR